MSKTLAAEKGRCGMKKGSALIMTIVLTVLLAVVGTMFLLMARTEKVATSSRSDNEELKLAAASIVGTISQVLADDVPRNNDPNRYYDYPGRWNADGTPNVKADGSLNDSNDAWLANLEPYEDPAAPGIYQWRHITDLYYATNAITHRPIDPNSQYAYRVPLLSGVQQTICQDYQKNIDTTWANPTSLADADGDGVADSRWARVPNLTTSKGKPVYAAVRIVDNGGMLNVNTAYKFDPKDRQRSRIDGSSQTNINLAALSQRTSSNGAPDSAALTLFNERVDASGATVNTNQLSRQIYGGYIGDIVRRMQPPVPPSGTYTPFDISDELKLRNRYIINDGLFDTRIEKLWTNAYNDYNGALNTPIDTSADLTKWFEHATPVPIPPAGKIMPLDYDFHHISTNYNVDRIIDPLGRPMFWINSNSTNMDANELYRRMLTNVNPDFKKIPSLIRGEYAQIAANIRDYRDVDPNVTTIIVNPGTGDADNTGDPYYGFDRPIMYLSELARNFYTDSAGTVNRSYAIEVYKSPGREKFTDWRIVIEDSAGAVKDTILLNDQSFSKTNGRFFVRRYNNASADLGVDFTAVPFENGAENVPLDTTFAMDPLSGGDLPQPPNPADANYIYTYKYGYDVYFGTDEDKVTSADTSDTTGIYLGPTQWDSTSPPTDGATLIPVPSPMDKNTTYYMRGDYVIETTVTDKKGKVVSDTTDVMEGDPEYFTTGDGTVPGPNDVPNTTQIIFDTGYTIKLIRSTKVNGTTVDLVADAVKVPPSLGSTGSDGIVSYQRDSNGFRWIQRFWGDAGTNLTLGYYNWFSCLTNTPAPPAPLQLWVGDRGRWFRNVGDLGYMFKKPVYYVDAPGFTPGTGVNPPDGVIGYDAMGADKDFWRKEQNVRISLYDPNVQKVFQYITVFNPSSVYNPVTHVYDNVANETRVKGRININTAPWYVIAQLPWVSQRKEFTGPTFTDYSLAQAIVAYRDKLNLSSLSPSGPDYYHGGAIDGRHQGAGLTGLREVPGFASIGELTTVVNGLNGMSYNNSSMWWYGLDTKDQEGFPDLTTSTTRFRRGAPKGDGVPDDFEERNLIFARISDLVTVRSDVFTAYMLIRLGDNGPQRRMIAILDRSEAPTKPVKVIALQQVPDAR